MLNRSGKRKIINPDHVKIKPNFVNDSFEYLPYERRKKRFVYAGRLDPLKGINILLDAWKLLGNDAPELVICGSGPMEEWCKEYIEKNHLSTVEMKGQMSNSDVRMIMGDSQGIILPTQWYEGFPMTIVEAFSMHVPVIGSEIGNVGEIIRDGRNGYVFRHDSAQDLADVIMKMMRNPIEIEQESIEAYSAERNYLILNEIYEDAVKEC
ncbi:glycosyltransferase, partial [Anaerostipes sp.]|uniref:glycosyltransferase n=1 Tax=Anaerostipes sp. TaxID=1872530 RepID=UPI0025903229